MKTPYTDNDLWLLWCGMHDERRDIRRRLPKGRAREREELALYARYSARWAEMARNLYTQSRYHVYYKTLRWSPVNGQPCRAQLIKPLFIITPCGPIPCPRGFKNDLCSRVDNFDFWPACTGHDKRYGLADRLRMMKRRILSCLQLARYRRMWDWSCMYWIPVNISHTPARKVKAFVYFHGVRIFGWVPYWFME